MLNEWTSLVISHQHQLDKKSMKMSRNYYCIDCKMSTRNPRVYLEHRRDFHQESITIHKCTLCVYASKHSQKLSRHMRTVHRNVIQSVVHPISKNAHGAFMANVPELLPDLQGDKSARISTCKLCGLYTANKAILMQHIRAEHPEAKIYKCDQCEYSHYIRDRYNRHHRYHSMDYVRCKLCEFHTIYRWNLERHMRHHTDSISLGFRCKKCNFTASTKQSITAHEIAHHSELTEFHPSQLITSAVNSAMEGKMSIEQNNVNRDSDGDLNEEESTSDFDASDFLEVVLDPAKSKIANSSNVLQPTAIVKQESAFQPLQRCPPNANKTRIYYCSNCSFR